MKNPGDIVTIVGIVKTNGSGKLIFETENDRAAMHNEVVPYWRKDWIKKKLKTGSLKAICVPGSSKSHYLVAFKNYETKLVNYYYILSGKGIGIMLNIPMEWIKPRSLKLIITKP